MESFELVSQDSFDALLYPPLLLPLAPPQLFLQEIPDQVCER